LKRETDITLIHHLVPHPSFAVVMFCGPFLRVCLEPLHPTVHTCL